MSDQPKAPLTTTTSIWPAAAVLIVAVVMLGVFMLINLVADQGVSSSTTTVAVVVGGLDVAPTNVALDYCRHTSEIPTNVPNAGAGDFDCYQPLITRASAGSLLNFYAAHLESLGWNLFSHGASNGSPQSLFQKAGNDGFYWVVGITVNSVQGANVHWTYRIYQNSQTI